MLVVMQVTVSVAIMQLEVSAAFMQVKVSSANVWVTIFIETAGESLCCNHAGSIFYSGLCTYYFDFSYAGVCFCCSYICDSFK